MINNKLNSLFLVWMIIISKSLPGMAPVNNQEIQILIWPAVYEADGSVMGMTGAPGAQKNRPGLIVTINPERDTISSIKRKILAQNARDGNKWQLPRSADLDWIVNMRTINGNAFTQDHIKTMQGMHRIFVDIKPPRPSFQAAY